MATLVSSSFTQGPVGSSVRSSRREAHPRSPRPSDAGREMSRRSLQGLGVARPWSSRRRCSVRLVGPTPSARPRLFGPHGQVAPVRHRRGRSEFVSQHHYTPPDVYFLRGSRQGLRTRRGWSCTGPQARSDGLRLRIDGRDCRCRPRHMRLGLIPVSAGEPLRDVPICAEVREACPSFWRCALCHPDDAAAVRGALTSVAAPSPCGLRRTLCAPEKPIPRPCCLLKVACARRALMPC